MCIDTGEAGNTPIESTRFNDPQLERGEEDEKKSTTGSD